MNIADRIYEAVKSMPEQQAAEVLDFAEFLQAKTGCSRQETGLTKREYFATAAYLGLLSDPKVEKIKEAAKTAVECADYLIDALGADDTGQE